jgi:aminoglycoside phosphotransferase family enzyme/predicted kinase
MNDLAVPLTPTDLLSALQDPAAFPHPVRDLQVIETHISWVLLTGEFAYKIKKPVRLGFLDFSTLELRRHYCEEELRINRRTAPELYLGVVPIGRSRGGVRVGAEPALEYAVHMRQFAHGERLDRCLQAGQLQASDMRELATTLARFHRGLPARDLDDREIEVERVVRPARNNFVHLEPQSFGDAAQQRLAVIEAWTLQQAQDLAPLFVQRARQGAVRECHGDLHLENLLLREGRYIAFDALEFSENLRWIDVANDIAFLVMDLLARGRPDLGYPVLDAWLEDSGDYDSLAVMRFYLVYRSMVRAVVAAIRAGQRDGRPEDSARPAASRYVELAADTVDTPPPRLYLMHGLSGSGKTWLSERLVARLPALRVRSDVVRKRLPDLAAGQRETGRLGEGLYADEVTERTYGALARHCETGLRAGFDMIADATFLHRQQRERFYEMAARLGVDATVLACRAPENVLRARIQQRGAGRRDASDADLAVLEHQLRHSEAPGPQEPARVLDVDTAGDAEAALARALAAR